MKYPLLPRRPAACLLIPATLLIFAVLAPAAHGGQQPPRNLRTTYPLTFEKIKATLGDLAKASVNPNPLAKQRETGLQRLKAFRFLCGVPYLDLKLDDEFNDFADAAAKICQKLNKLDLNPPNPGLREDDYQKALTGLKHANLGMSSPKADLILSLNTFMDNSDPGNLKTVGNRRWCLAPDMGKTGFGVAGTFCAMYTGDDSNPTEFDSVCYPAKGFMPVEYFKADSPWSVTLNPMKFDIPNDKDVSVKVYPANLQGEKPGPALQLNHLAINRQGFSVPLCLIFRPQKGAVLPGRLYLVEISGVTQKDGTAVQITYPVEFVSLTAGPAKL